MAPSNEGQTLNNIRRNRFYDTLPSEFLLAIRAGLQSCTKTVNYTLFLDDENRVKLVGLSHDYINASYIRAEDGSVQYIAAQGPIGDDESVGGRRDCTIADFWHMVWQEKIDCIVMLCQCIEHRRVNRFCML